MMIAPVDSRGLGVESCFFIQERLQNKRRCHLINDAAVVLACVAGFVKNLVSLLGGQALVPQVNRQAGQLAQLRCKCLCDGRLRSCLAGKMERVANHNAHNAEAPRQPRQGA